MIYRDKGDTAESLASFRRALELQPGFEDAARGVAEVLLETGSHADGLAALRNVFGMIRFDVQTGVSVTAS
mgnify:CR=1 FL=1